VNTYIKARAFFLLYFSLFYEHVPASCAHQRNVFTRCVRGSTNVQSQQRTSTKHASEQTQTTHTRTRTTTTTRCSVDETQAKVAIAFAIDVADSVMQRSNSTS
jgi:hypothetical protein